MKDRFGDFTGIREIQLPVSLAPREGKYYGTEIVDARGAVVINLWSDVESLPSEREKAYFGSDWSLEAWSDYCCDSHWERQADYLAAQFIVKSLNLSMQPVYAGEYGRLKYAINRFSVSLNDINDPDREFQTWKQMSKRSQDSGPLMDPMMKTAQR